MKRIAVIRNGIVENIAVWDGIQVWNPAHGAIEVDITNHLEVDIGWLYDGQNFSAPPGDEG